MARSANQALCAQDGAVTGRLLDGGLQEARAISGGEAPERETQLQVAQ